VISITCALLATLLQQWARRYLKVTQPRYSPHRRARIRAFFTEGVDKFLLPWAVEALPTMLHVSLFLFFAGLAVFLWNVDLTIFKLVLSWVGLCAALYGCITIIPVFRHDSPYHTPLSLPTWHFVTGIQFLIFRALEWFTVLDYFSYATYQRFQNIAKCYRKSLVQGMQKAAEECAFGSPSEIDTRAFLWTFDSLDEDHELERFFSGLPGFRSSKVVKDPLPDLTSEQQEKLLNAWVGLLDRTSSSDLLPEPAQIRRTVICVKAIGPAGVPGAINQLADRIVYSDRFGPLQSTNIARSLRGWDNDKDEETTILIRAISSSVVARAQRRDDLWFTMASDEMGVSESVLRNLATHNNSLSLAILIHVVRQQFNLFGEQYWPWLMFWKVLEAASKFDVLDTSPELQHEFCALWNQVVRTGGSKFPGSEVPAHILSPIRNIYLTLHLHTNSAPTAFSDFTGDEDNILWYPSSYPLCNISSHHPDSTTLIRDASTSTAIPHAALLHDDGALAPGLSPHAPPLSVPTQIHVGKNPLGVVLLDGNTFVPTFLHPAPQTATATDSPSPAAVASARNTSSRTRPPTIQEILMSTSLVPPTGQLSLEKNADLLVHSGAREIPSSASRSSPELVLKDITGPSLLTTYLLSRVSLRDTS
jgi:hypothetical protein